MATDLSGVLEEVAEAGESVQWAIRNAKGRIEAVRSIRSGFEILAAMMTLAEALASRNTKLVLESAKELGAHLASTEESVPAK